MDLNRRDALRGWVCLDMYVRMKWQFNSPDNRLRLITMINFVFAVLLFWGFRYSKMKISINA